MSAKSTTGQPTQGADNFYDALSSSSPQYDSPMYQQDTAPVDPQEQAVREQEWKSELAKLEEEIATLRSVLDAKVFEASELKRKLGITPLVELKDDFKHGMQVFRESEPVQKTNAAIKSFGAFASKKFGDLRNSNVFKSVEEKVGGAYHSVKEQISGPTTPSAEPDPNGFEDALRSEVSIRKTEPVSARYVPPPAVPPKND